VIRAIVTACLVCLGGAALAQDTSGSDQDTATSGQGAVLRGLDKVNGQTVDVEVHSGGAATVFGLDVALAECRFPTENPTGDAFAFLTIKEHDRTDIWFEGWMIASAPALNALDHARYDVWVLRCITS